MAIFTHQCPHCLTDHIGLQLVHTTKDKTGAICYGNLVCPRCRKPSGAAFLENPHFQPHPANWELIPQMAGDVTDHGWELFSYWPEVPKPQIPENIPPDVERIYLQAERNFPIEGNEEAAGTMYRKALDIGLKRIDSALSGTLAARIKKLSDCGKVTPEIATWSDCIRDIGNDAAHEDEPITRQELDDLRNFSDAVLRYLFSLPGMVRKRRGERLDWEE